MKILVKVSGDLVEEESFYIWLSSLCGARNNGNKLTVGVDGGEGMLEILEINNINYCFNSAGLKIESKLEGDMDIVLRFLEQKKKALDRMLSIHRIKAVIFKPIINISGERLIVDGDLCAIMISLNFDRTVIVSKKKEGKKGRKRVSHKLADHVEIVDL